MANKISLNFKKLKWSFFNLEEKSLMIKVNCQKYLSNCKCQILGVKNDQYVTWPHHINDFSVKLNRDNALLFKMRKFVDDKILRSIYLATFESNLNYCSLVWAQSYNAINLLVILQKKVLRIMNFQP